MQRSDLNFLAEAYSSINNNQQINEGISDSLVTRAGAFLLKKLQQVNPSAFKQLQQIVSSKDKQTLSNIINKPLVQKAINNFSQPIQESIIGDTGKIIKKIYDYFMLRPKYTVDPAKLEWMSAFIIGALCILSAIHAGDIVSNSVDNFYDKKRAQEELSDQTLGDDTEEGSIRYIDDEHGRSIGHYQGRKRGQHLDYTIDSEKQEDIIEFLTIVFSVGGIGLTAYGAYYATKDAIRKVNPRDKK